MCDEAWFLYITFISILFTIIKTFTMLKPILVLSVATAIFFASCSNNMGTTNCATTTDSLQKEIAARDTRINVLLDSLKMMMAGSTVAAPVIDTTVAATATADTKTAGATAGDHSFYKGGKHIASTGGKNSKIPGEFPEGSARILTEKDLKFLSQWGLQVMLNEIYARHGMKFSNSDLQNHFNRQGWYHGSTSDVNGKLSATERKNVEFIKSYKFNPQIGV